MQAGSKQSGRHEFESQCATRADSACKRPGGRNGGRERCAGGRGARGDSPDGDRGATPRSNRVQRLVVDRAGPHPWSPPRRVGHLRQHKWQARAMSFGSCVCLFGMVSHGYMQMGCRATPTPFPQDLTDCGPGDWCAGLRVPRIGHGTNAPGIEVRVARVTTAVARLTGMPARGWQHGRTLDRSRGEGGSRAPCGGVAMLEIGLDLRWKSVLFTLPVCAGI